MIKKKKEETIKEEIKVVEEIYFFPDYGISVKASSREEAEQKLKEIIEK